jgi:hypothetical protein
MPIVILVLVAALAQGGRVPRVDQVAWLRGCWEAQTREGTIEAQWLAPRASSILGVSRTIHGTTLVGYEMDLIREGGDRLDYEAHPSNGLPGLFMSVAIADGKVVFENLKEQFPARIGYELSAPGRLAVWSEGPENGNAKRVELRYSRVRCPED